MSDIPTTIKNRALVEKRREQIVLAAIKLFSKKGFHKTTLRELSDEADVSSGNIYDYVGSKDDIFYLIHEYFCDRTFEALNRAIEKVNDPLEKLRRMIRAEFNLMDQWSDAILLLYQEGHVLNTPFLQKFLEKEHNHVQMFEGAIKECVAKGLLRDCNARLAANHIKVMLDCWVLKRWDLRGYATGPEAEKFVLEMIFYGLLPQTDHKSKHPVEIDTLRGKRALVVGGDTVLGAAVSSVLSSKGLDVCTFLSANSRIEKEKHGVYTELDPRIRRYYEKEYGPICAELFRFIESDFGPIDIYIEDTGIGSLKEPSGFVETGKPPEAAKLLETRLGSAQNVARALQEEMMKKAWGRIVYIAPWAWDRYLDPICYNTAQAGTLALTETLAKSLAPYSINVNCIVPGFIKTARPSDLQKARAEQAAAQIPASRLGDVSDVTNIVIFLLGDDTRYLTNQVLRVPGGC